MMKKYRIFIFSIFLSLFLFLPLSAKAGSASFGFSGGATLEYGGSTTISLYVRGISGVVNSASGSIYSTNPGCVTVEGNTKFIGAYFDGRTSDFEVATVTVRAQNSACSASISVAEGKIAFMDSTEVTPSTSVNVSVVAPKSGNNNLSGLSISNASINFSPGNTNYSVSVPANVSSVTISATKEDARASVSGDGNKGLGYGNNTFYVVVTAENGSKKTYTINVHRADNRSGNNNLKSLSFSNAKLKTEFNPNNTNYSISVPYEVTKLNINAVASDSKARISINNPDLVSEEEVTATITVTAENGAQKTYTLKVLRGKDPNKVLSTNGYLSTLKANYGDLSPKFDKEKKNYALYIPYEVEDVVFTYEVEDKKYATVKVEKPEKLISDSNNLYKFIVKAEDESETIYTVNVFRGKNMDETAKSVSLNIKKLKVKSGKLSTDFNNNETNYTYTGDFKCEFELEDENAVSDTYEDENLFLIKVADSLGNVKVYSFKKQNSNLVIYILLGLNALLVLYIIYLQFLKDKIINRKKGK